MTPAQDDARRVAEGLSEAQRKAVLSRSGPHDVVTSPDVEPLWFSIQKHAPKDFTISLNQAGLAVRRELERGGS